MPARSYYFCNLYIIPRLSPIMKATIFTVNAFTDSESGGNPAGVCLGAEFLSDKQMQNIATQIGFSETAFLLPSDRAYFRLRYFTPTTEVDACGHATIAAFHVMGLKNIISPEVKYHVEIAAGPLRAEVRDSGSVLMDQMAPDFLHFVEPSELETALGLETDALYDSLPAQVVSTGMPTLLVPMHDFNAVYNLSPNMKKISQLQNNNDGAIIYAVSLETIGRGYSAHARMFDPKEGIPEESATGMAAGALAAYLQNRQHIPVNEFIKIEQGYELNRPSEILAKVVVANGTVESVVIGGNAILTGEKILDV